MLSKKAGELAAAWKENPRWKGITRLYKAEDVLRLRGSLPISYTLAEVGAQKLWQLLESDSYVQALGAMTGLQAVQQVQAGLKAIYVSGWQVAADSNDASETYPDQSLYPVSSVPHLIHRIQNALVRADQIQCLQKESSQKESSQKESSKEQSPIDWFVPLVADAEAGFGGPLNTFELIKAMIREGAAAVHLEDQLSSLKKCGHLGGKVLVPASEFIQKLSTARLAADILDVPILIIARTDAESAGYIRSDADTLDKPFLTQERSPDGFYKVASGIEYAIARALAYAPYADMIWCETSKPDLKEAQQFAEGVHKRFPGKWLAYNCSPSFNWWSHLSEAEAKDFQKKLAQMGYKFQFVTLAGFHTLNASMFSLASEYIGKGMGAYAKLQKSEYELEKQLGYKALKHQSFVGTGYFDEVMMAVTGGDDTTQALKGSTEEKLFH